MSSRENATIPKLIMMIGIPASGKSYIAEQIKLDGEKVSDDKIVIHSSDKLRKELFDDVNDQSNNAELFKELEKRIKVDLANGVSVIYDATNINKKRRKSFLNTLKNISCEKICAVVLSPYEDCINSNHERDRCIPDEVITRMYKHYQPPSIKEGFDNIVLMYNILDSSSVDKYTINNFLYGDINACSIDQGNHHHTETIGNHCKCVYEYLCNKHPCDYVTQIAGMLHDVGKPFTKTNIKSDGTIDTECHYYNHESVGAYDSFFYTMNLGMSYADRLRIANAVYYHMLPITAWVENEKSQKRFRYNLGDDMYQMVIKISEADVAASR